MERGRAWSSGTAAAALTGVVLTGGATLGAAAAQAAPVVPHAPVAPVCTVAATTYRQPPVEPGATATPRPAVLADAAGRCVDAISKDLLGPADVLGHGLVRVPAAKPRPKPAPVPTTTAPKPTTTVPTAPKPTTTVPTTPKPTTTVPTTTVPTTTVPTTSVPTTTTTLPAADGGAAGGAASGATPTSSTPPTTTTAPRPSAARRSVAAASVPGSSAPAARAVPPAPAAADPLAALAPLSAVAPGDAAAVPAVEPASYLDPLGPPGIGALPGEPTILHTLGGDTSGVTTSSRVQALGLDALHRGGGVPAVVGVTIMAGLGGLALRHRILQRIRRTEPVAGGPDPAPDLATDRAFAAGRHVR